METIKAPIAVDQSKSGEKINMTSAKTKHWSSRKPTNYIGGIVLSKAPTVKSERLRICELKEWESEEENLTIGKLGNTFSATIENIETHVSMRS